MNVQGQCACSRSSDHRPGHGDDFVAVEQEARGILPIPAVGLSCPSSSVTRLRKVLAEAWLQGWADVYRRKQGNTWVISCNGCRE